MKIKNQKSIFSTFLTLGILCGISIGGFYYWKSIHKIESQMLHDGYNMAQINEMRIKAFDKAYEMKNQAEKHST